MIGRWKRPGEPNAARISNALWFSGRSQRPSPNCGVGPVRYQCLISSRSRSSPRLSISASTLSLSVASTTSGALYSSRRWPRDSPIARSAVQTSASTRRSRYGMRDVRRRSSRRASLEGPLSPTIVTVPSVVGADARCNPATSMGSAARILTRTPSVAAATSVVAAKMPNALATYRFP